MDAALELLTVPFLGATLQVSQRPIAQAAAAPAGGAGGAAAAAPPCPTGCLLWPASRAVLALLEALPLPLLLAGSASASYIDLSPGVGLTSLALARLSGPGGRVLALDLPGALPLLAANLRAEPRCCAAAHGWGQGLRLGAQLAGAPPVALALAVDVLYCAVRDGLAAELAQELAELALAARLGVLIAWQPRRGSEELALLRAAAGARPGLLQCSAPARVPAAGLHAGIGHPSGAIFLPPSLFPEALAGEEEGGGQEGEGVLCAVLQRAGAPRLPLAGCVPAPLAPGEQW